MKHEVFWKNLGYKPRPELHGDIECEYLIVGGGVTGVATAYFLSKFGGKDIVLIEKNHIASGATGQAAGTLVLRGEKDLVDIMKKHGADKGEVYWKEIHEGLKGIKKVINDENIDCDSEPQDTLYCDFLHKSHINLHQEYLAEKKLETTTRFLEKDELKKEINTPLFAHGLFSANHGLSVNPLKLTQNLSKVIEKYGVKVYENTKLEKLFDHRAVTGGGNISFKKIIWAIDVDYPAEEIKKLKSTIVITQPLTFEEFAQTGLAKKKIVFDAKKNYNYFKITKDRRLLLGFGNLIVRKSDNKNSVHPPHLENIRRFAKRLFPYLRLEFEYAWSGNFGVTSDYDPLVEFKNGSAVISGAGSQVTCFMAAKHVAHKLLGQTSSLEEFFKD